MGGHYSWSTKSSTLSAIWNPPAGETGEGLVFRAQVAGGEADGYASDQSSVAVCHSTSLQVTTTNVTSSADTIASGQPMTFTATIVGGNSPSGTLAFVDGSTPLCLVSPVGEVATCTTTAWQAGNRTIIAAYSGNAANSASSGTVQLVVVDTVFANGFDGSD